MLNTTTTTTTTTTNQLYISLFVPTSTTNVTSPAETDTQNWLFVIQVACLSVICLIGTIGNTVICSVLLRAKRKSSDYFILNLATTDLLVCSFGIPLDIYEQNQGNTWPYGNVACHVIYPSQTLLVLVSIMTLTAMSLERYRAIMTPLKHKLSKKAIIAAIFFIWNLGFVVVVPYSRILTYKEGGCLEQWPGDNDGNYYTLALFIIDYCIPLTIITYCYSRAGYNLHTSCTGFQEKNGSQKNHSAMRKRLESNKRVIKTFSLAVVVFVVCMLPGDAYWMWSSFGDTSSFDYETHLKTFTVIMLYANSAINPFIFGACRRGCRSRRALGRRYNTMTNTTSTRSTVPLRSYNASKSTLRCQDDDESKSNGTQRNQDDNQSRVSVTARKQEDARETKV